MAIKMNTKYAKMTDIINDYFIIVFSTLRIVKITLNLYGKNFVSF